MYRLVIPMNLWQQLHAHFLAGKSQEDGAFLLIRSGRTASGKRLLAHALLLPPEWRAQHRGADNLRPSSQWLSAVIGSAIATHSGFAFIHSHPGDRHPPDLSQIDRETSRI